MKKQFIIGVLAVVLCFVGCGSDKSVSPQQDTLDMTDPSVQAELVALELLTESSWPADVSVEMPSGDKLARQKPMYGSVGSFQRESIAADIAHYSFQIPVGPGQYDVIAIHRVVKESRPFRPIKTKKAIFLHHGDFGGFEFLFLPGKIVSGAPDDFGIAGYLAANDVDVWGMEQPWILVPETTTNFAFMTDWGMQWQIGNLNTALFIARFTRLLTGNGLKKMQLLGYSMGASLGYSFLNDETQKPAALRQVDGYIAVDMAIKTDDEPFRQLCAARYDEFIGNVNSGTPQEFIALHLISNLSSSDPDGASPIIPGFTNRQVLLFLSGGPAEGVFPWHYFAPDWNGPVPPLTGGGLQFVTVSSIEEGFDAVAYYEPYRVRAEWAGLIGDEVDLPFDDYWSEIDVPILNLGAAGGMGPYTAFGTAQIGSSEITQILIQLQPAGSESIDFGHGDIAYASNAEALAWQPMLAWIEAHTN